MLILPPGHHNEVAKRRTLTRRERGIAGGLAVIVVALLIAVVISTSSGPPKSAHGCVYVTINSSTGALTLQGCGARARTICADATVAGAYPPSTVAIVVRQCELAGLPTRRLS